MPGVAYTPAVTSIYQKLSNLPHGLGEQRTRYFTALVQACWHVDLPAGFCGGSIVLQLLHLYHSWCLSGVFCQGPQGLPAAPRLCATITQLDLPFSSDLFLFGLCSLQQIGYALAKQFSRSAASVTFSCPHTRFVS